MADEETENAEETTDEAPASKASKAPASKAASKLASVPPPKSKKKKQSAAEVQKELQEIVARLGARRT